MSTNQFSKRFTVSGTTVLGFLLLWSLLFPLRASSDIGVQGASANRQKVLQVTWTVVAKEYAVTTLNVDVHNAQNAWYYVEADGMAASQKGDVPNHFVIGPYWTLSFHNIKFMNGNSLSFSADGSGHLGNGPLVTYEATGMMAVDMLSRAFLGTKLSSDDASAWSEFYGSSVDDSSDLASDLTSMASSVKARDYWGILYGIANFAESPSVQTEFLVITKREIPVKQISYIKAVVALYYVSDLVIGTLRASLSDSLWDNYTLSGRQTSPPPFPNPKLFVSESDAAPANGMPGFQRYGPTQFWHDAAGIGDGGHMFWTYNNDAAHGVSNMADWRPNLPQTRNYEVIVFIPHNYATTQAAHYQVYSSDGRHDVAVNQYSYNDAWVSLGTYPFNIGSGGFLRLVDQTNEKYATKKVGFDAAQWQPR